MLTGRVIKARISAKRDGKSNDTISDDAEIEVGDDKFDDIAGSGAEDGDEFKKNIALRIKKKDVD